MFLNILCQEFFLQTGFVLISEVFISNEVHKYIGANISESCYVKKIVNFPSLYLVVSLQDGTYWFMPLQVSYCISVVSVSG